MEPRVNKGFSIYIYILLLSTTARTLYTRVLILQIVIKGLGAKDVEHEDLMAPEKTMMPHISTSTWLRRLSVAAASKSFEDTTDEESVG